jgi:hypothetical protein
VQIEYLVSFDATIVIPSNPYPHSTDFLGAVEAKAQ